LFQYKCPTHPHQSLRSPRCALLYGPTPVRSSWHNYGRPRRLKCPPPVIRPFFSGFSKEAPDKPPLSNPNDIQPRFNTPSFFSSCLRQQVIQSTFIAVTP